MQQGRKVAQTHRQSTHQVVKIAPVAAQQQRAVAQVHATALQSIERSLHEVVEVVLLLEDLGLLAQARGAGLLVL
jgi:phosphoenolpyruvate carboxylase